MQKLNLVGKTSTIFGLRGTGKSTFVNYILTLYKHKAKTILIDN